MSLAQRYQQLIADSHALSVQLNHQPPGLIAVSKTRSAAEIKALAELGQLDFGENYVQEALPKIAELRALTPALIWHFIGPIQSNKTKTIATHFAWVHSLTRLDHAQRLSRQRGELIAEKNLTPLQVCIQINSSGEASKAGIAPAELPALAAEIWNFPHLCLRGLMALPTALNDAATSQDQLAQEFALMQELLAHLQKQFNAASNRAPTHTLPDVLSMGMSADWPVALGYGATHIRVGTQLFGARLN